MDEIQNEMIQFGVYALVVRGEGQDLLMGKNINRYTEIKGLENLLKKFIIDLDHFFEDIYNNDIPAYLANIEKRFHLDLSFLASNLVQNISEMKTTDSEDIMIFYLVITKTLEHLRQKIFTDFGWKIIGEYFLEEFGEELQDEDIKRIEERDYEGDPDMSLLYNLVFIQFLAKIYEDNNIGDIVSKQIKKSLKNFFSIY